MFGVNLSGAEFGSGSRYGWDYIYPSSSMIKYYADKGVDTIRLPMKWERVQPTLGGELNAAEIGRIKNVLDAAQANGVKVVLDIHNFGGYAGNIIGSSAVPVSSFVDLWTKLAGALKSHPAMDGYGLMNEPIGFSDPNAWPAMAQAAINAIRTVDEKTAIYVMGQGWGAAQTWLQLNDNLKYLKDPSSNLVFEAHQYFDRWTSGTYQGSYDAEGAYANVGVDRVQPFLKWLKDNNLKGFIGEYSVPDNDPRWLTVMDNFLAELAKNGVGSAYYGAGPWWGNYAMSMEPENGVDSGQLQILMKNVQGYREMLSAMAVAKPDVIPVHEMLCTKTNDNFIGLTGYTNVAHGDFGHDRLTGADRHDELFGGVGNDILHGMAGNDSVYGEAGNDTLYGDEGDDIVDGGDGLDTLYGGEGNDVMTGGDAADILYGDGGDDSLEGGAGDDKLYGGTGKDILLGGDGADRLEGEDGDDLLDGANGNDLMYGGNGNDVLLGGDGIDTIYGGVGNDRIEGGGLNDRLRGEEGADQIYGGTGDDIIYGGDGDDILNGDQGMDYLSGGLGNDRIYGGDGADKLYGDEGNDWLYGGAGADHMWGGTGKDTFVLQAATSYTDLKHIEDFNRAEGDRIDLSNLLQGFDPLTKAITDFVQIKTQGRDSILSVDANGGGDHFVAVVMIHNVTGLTDEQALLNAGNLVASA